MTHLEGKLGMAVGVMITLELLVSPPATPIPQNLQEKIEAAWGKFGDWCFLAPKERERKANVITYKYLPKTKKIQSSRADPLNLHTQKSLLK